MERDFYSHLKLTIYVSCSIFLHTYEKYMTCPWKVYDMAPVFFLYYGRNQYGKNCVYNNNYVGTINNLGNAVTIH